MPGIYANRMAREFEIISPMVMIMSPWHYRLRDELVSYDDADNDDWDWVNHECVISLCRSDVANQRSTPISLRGRLMNYFAHQSGNRFSSDMDDAMQTYRRLPMIFKECHRWDKNVQNYKIRLKEYGSSSDKLLQQAILAYDNAITNPSIPARVISLKGKPMVVFCTNAIGITPDGEFKSITVRISKEYFFAFYNNLDELDAHAICHCPHIDSHPGIINIVQRYIIKHVMDESPVLFSV